MSFNFGNITQPAQNTLNFGAAATQPKPAFGTTPTTGFSFGQSSQPSSTPSFGFGATTTSTAPNFGFGSNFGAPAATSAPPAFGTLGATTTNTGFGGFGTTATPSFGFGPTTTTGFSFGSTAPTTTTAGFGGFGSFSTPATTTTGLFGNLGGAASTTSTFGGGLGLNFGAKPGFSFGGGTTGNTFGTNTFNTQQQQPQQQQQPDQNQLISNAVLNVRIFGDERDTILAKWNLLQASWGVGKGYYSQNQPPVEFKPENPYCRFKGIAYSKKPGRENKDGHVVLVFPNKKHSELKAQLPQILQSIQQNPLGNKPELKLEVEICKPTCEESSQLTISVTEKNSLGTTRKIPATDLSNFLNQQKQNLTTLGITKIFPNVKPDSEQVQEYLESPPAGLDPRIWKQAQEDNPNPEKFLPVPVIGFNQIKWKMGVQEEEAALHRAYLEKVMNDITKFKQKQTAAVARIAEQKRKFFDLQHRVLKILVKQEMYRKVGMALQPEEEQLRIQLENMQAQISIPTQFRGRLTELLAHIRILRCGDEPILTGTHMLERYTISPEAQEDVKQFLYLEQVGINHLIDTINNDQATLNKIKEGLQNILQT